MYLSSLQEAGLRSLNKGKRRPLNPLNWADRKNKLKKDAGEKYNVTKGKRAGNEVPALQPPTGAKVCGSCRKKGCNLPPDTYKMFFEKFRSANGDQQNQILADCLALDDPKERRVAPEAAEKFKKHTYRYSLKVNGRPTPVCRKRLLDTFAIKNSRLRTLISKLERGELTFEDGRGKTCGVHPSILTDDFKNKIRAHIKSFPTYESHYCRGEADAGRRYLDEELSVTKMVSLFNEIQAQSEDRICKFDAYNHIFKSEFDFRFGLPRKDTCNFCDGQKALIARTSNQAQVSVLEQSLHFHQEVAKSARAMHKADGSNKDTETYSITADMQKVLFVPRLSCSSAYFKRKLSTFKIGIHTTGEKDAGMFIWNETIAEHASKDVLSCVYKHIMSKFEKLGAGGSRNLILWTDRFVGQFNNCYLVLFMKFLVDKHFFTRVEHKFFVTGHSWMSCDRDFGLIEKRYKEMNPMVPTDIENVISTARVDHPFNITKMTRSDFLNFGILTNYVSLPTSVQVTKYHWFKYEASNPNVISAKPYHNSSDWKNFKLVMKKNTGFNSLRSFPVSYTKPIQITEAKAKDLRDLMDKIPDQSKYEYYDNLTKFVLA